MADLGAAGAAMIAAGWSGRKLLGPLFDEIAEAWRDRYSERRRRALARIGRNAEAKFDRHEPVDGSWASPRVVSIVIDSGSWCEGPVMAEYFGGILAAAVSPDGADDRGVTWASLLAQLSGQDVLLHYLAYQSVRHLYIGRDDLDLGVISVQEECLVYLPLDGLIQAMGFDHLGERAQSRVASAMLSLHRNGLVGRTVAISDQAWLSEEFDAALPGDGMVFTPSTAGIELFLWAHGHADVGWQDLTDPQLQIEPIEVLPTVADAIEVADLPPIDRTS